MTKLSAQGPDASLSGLHARLADVQAACSACGRTVCAVPRTAAAEVGAYLEAGSRLMAYEAVLEYAQAAAEWGGTCGALAPAVEALAAMPVDSRLLDELAAAALMEAAQQ